MGVNRGAGLPLAILGAATVTYSALRLVPWAVEWFSYLTGAG